MALVSGTQLGPYQLVAPIGAGGMGEVWRARDTKLNRDVALKILPEAFTLDGDRIARFRREAELLATLNHPNIAHIYGFEDSGSTHALVLELVEGPTLADRIAKGPIPLDEALLLAKQIAEALEAAHEPQAWSVRRRVAGSADGWLRAAVYRHRSRRRAIWIVHRARRRRTLAERSSADPVRKLNLPGGIAPSTISGHRLRPNPPE